MLFALSALAAGALCACDHPPSGPSHGPRSATELAGRLIAPCCWVQTLDIHESGLATTLRAEITMRLAEGETSQAIEDSLASRYGERIRAVPRGEDPRRIAPLLAGTLMATTLLGLFLLAPRWLRRNQTAFPTAASQDATDGASNDENDVYEQRLDRELAKLESL